MAAAAVAVRFSPQVPGQLITRVSGGTRLPVPRSRFHAHATDIVMRPCSVSRTFFKLRNCAHLLFYDRFKWAIPDETTMILPSKNDIGPWHILFLQILFFLHDSGQVCLPLDYKVK